MSAEPGSVLLLDQPDPRRRLHKAIWRQLRQVLAEAAGPVVSEVAGVRRVSVVTNDRPLADALAVDLGVPVRVVLPDQLRGAPRSPLGDHLVILPLELPLGTGARVDLLRRSLQRLRPTGRLVLAATVVSGPGGRAVDRPPSMSQLLEQLQAATGGSVHLDDLRSLRWSREPLRRGVCMTLTSLSSSSEW